MVEPKHWFSAYNPKALEQEKRQMPKWWLRAWEKTRARSSKQAEPGASGDAGAKPVASTKSVMPKVAPPELGRCHGTFWSEK